MRSGNAPSQEETVAMNGITAGEPSDGGRVVKIAVLERFRPQ
jgi:hypothetical protein